MLTGFKNAVEVDFTLEENKKKIEEAFKQAHAEAGAVYPLIIGGKKVETEKKIASVSPALLQALRPGYHNSCLLHPLRSYAGIRYHHLFP